MLVSGIQQSDSVTHIHVSGTYIQWNISHYKEWNNPICSNMDGPGDYHTKCSKSDREQQISYDIAYMWNLKKKKKRWDIFIPKMVGNTQ